MVRQVVRQVEPVQLDVDQVHRQGKLVGVQLPILSERDDERLEDTVMSPDRHLQASRSWQALGLEVET